MLLFACLFFFTSVAYAQTPLTITLETTSSTGETTNGNYSERNSDSGPYYLMGGKNGSSTVSSFDRWTRNGQLTDVIAGNSYEIRFTAVGGKAFTAFGNATLIDVPFELWNLSNTPENTADDVRMIPLLQDFEKDGFNFRSDHPDDTEDNDPASDWIYFIMPHDHTPGSAGYNQFVDDVTAGTNQSDDISEEHLARVVVMNLNSAGSGIPPTGTTFRLSFSNPTPTGVPDNVIYVSHYNKSKTGSNAGQYPILHVDVSNSVPSTQGVTNPKGLGPRGIALTNNKLYVANFLSNNVSVFNTSTNVLETTIELEGSVRSGRPDDIAITPDGGYAYLATVYNGIAVIETASNAIVATISIPKQDGTSAQLWDIAITPDGVTPVEAYVASATTNAIYVINHADILEQLTPGSDAPAAINFAPNATNAIAVGRQPAGIAIDHAGEFVYVANHAGRIDGHNEHSISVIDMAKKENIYDIPGGTHPMGITIHPNGQYLYVKNVGPMHHSQREDHISVIKKTVNDADQVSKLGISPVTWMETKRIQVGIDPFAADLSSDNRYLYVVNYKSQNVSVIDTQTNEVVDTIELENALGAWDIVVN